MAGIFGFFNLNEQADPEEKISILQQKSDQDFNHPSNIIMTKNFALGYSLPHYDKSWPLTDKDNNFVYQKMGEIYFSDHKPVSKFNFENQFLSQFLNSPNTFLNSINGAYIFILFDKLKNELYIVNDPFGNFALYYYSDGNGIIFSCQIHGIIDVLKSKEWNIAGLHQYLGVGFPMNGDSLYKNIFKLEPATIIRFSDKGIRKSSYYKPRFIPSGNPEENISQISDSLTDIIEKNIAAYDKIGAALTGGFDSRITWGIILNKNLQEQVKAYTHGLKSSYDMEIALKIAGKLKLNHITQEFDHKLIEKLPDLWYKFTEMNEGINPVCGAFTIAVWEFSKNHFSTIIDSHGGAIYRRSLWKFAEKRFDKNKSFTKQFYNLLISPLINFPFVNEDLKKAIKQEVNTALNIFREQWKNEEEPGNLFDLFYLYQTSALKYSNAANVQLNYMRIVHPFLNLKAFNAVQRINLSLRRNQYIYRKIVSRTCPDLEKFFMENMGFKIPYFAANSLRYIPMAYEKVLEKVMVKTDIQMLKNFSVKRFVTDHNLFYKINFSHINDILMRKNDTFFDLIERRNLEDYLQKITNKKAFNYACLDSLLTFKLYLDSFHP